MKRYRLINDLPTFKAGDTFHIEDDGCLYLDDECVRGSEHWHYHLMAYHKHTLDRFPNILADWFEEIDDQETIMKLQKELAEARQRIRELEWEKWDRIVDDIVHGDRK